MNQTETAIAPGIHLTRTRVADATPGLVSTHALNHQALLLAKLRHNRLIDVFTGIACYSLQRHVQTDIPGVGRIETPEIYIGVDRNGTRYVFPVQANRESAMLIMTQIEECFAVCAKRFPSFVCRPIAAQFMADDLIALFELELIDDRIAKALEKHYRLVPPDEVTASDLAAYRSAPFG